MKLNKIFIVSLIILAILTVGAVSASDNVTSDDLSSNLEDSDALESSIDDDLSAIGDDSDDKKANEEIEETDNILSSGNEDIIAVEENDVNTIIGKEITNDEPILTSQIINKEILSDYDDDLYTLKLTFVKQTGKYTNNKKVYFKVTWVDGGMGAYDVQIKYVVYKSNGAKEKVGYATTNSNGIGCIKFADGKAHIGTFKIKAELYHWDGSFYGDTVYTDPATIKNVKIYKSRYKVSTSPITKRYKKSALFKVTVKDKASGKRLKGIKVIMKVYTGKKYKKIVHKTNKKGKTGFNTKHLSKGKHKVVIIIKANSKYKKTVKRSSVTIKGKTNNNKNKKAKTKKTTKTKKTKTKKTKTKKGKLKTKFEFIDLKYNRAPNGRLDSVTINLNLIDQNGKILKNKKITGQMYIHYYNEIQTYGPLATGRSGKSLEIFRDIGGWQSFIEVEFKGDSKYKGATYTMDISI